jgi:hypothetical protein
MTTAAAAAGLVLMLFEAVSKFSLPAAASHRMFQPTIRQHPKAVIHSYPACRKACNPYLMRDLTGRTF